MIPFWKPFSTYAPGSSMDCWMNLASLPLRNLFRFGPMVPVAPASASVWQEEQAGLAVLVKIVLPSGAAPPAAAWARLAASHLSNAAGETTWALWRMTACPSPHSSAHTTGNVPVLIGL